MILFRSNGCQRLWSARDRQARGFEGRSGRPDPLRRGPRPSRLRCSN
jgi:hypothetical protein